MSPRLPEALSSAIRAACAPPRAGLRDQGVDPGGDAEALLAEAASRAVFGLVYEYVVPNLRDAESPSQADRYRTGVHRALSRTRGLKVTVDGLGAAGIAVLSIKGPVLNQLAFGRPHAREMVDLDILLRPADMPAAVEWFAARGCPCWALIDRRYTSFASLSPAARRALTRTHHEVFVRHPEWGDVELHWRLAPRFTGLDLDAALLFSRSQSVSLGHCAIPTLSDEDHFLVAAISLARDRWTNLGTVAAFSWLAERPLHMAYVMAEARRQRLLGALQLSMLVADALLFPGDPVFEPYLRATPARLHALLPGIIDGFRRGPAEGLVGALTWRDLQVHDRWADRARGFLDYVLTPTAVEYTPGAIPTLVRRPLRLLRRVVRGEPSESPRTT